MRCSTRLMWPAAAVAAAAVATPAFGAADLFVAGTIGEVYMGDPVTGGFEYWGGICLAPVHSLGIGDVGVFAGDINGGILRMDLQSGEFISLYWVPGDATDIVMHDGDLLVSTSFGDVHRVDPVSGTVESTLSHFVGIDAMTLHGDDLFVAGPDGAIYKGDAVTGGFQYFGCACLGPIQALAHDGQTLYAGDVTGAILQFELATGIPLDFFWVSANGISGLAVLGQELLASNAGDQILRVDPATGVIIDTLTSPIIVDAIELLLPLGDIDGDGGVGISDFLIVLDSWGACPDPPAPCPADLDGDGLVGITDFLIVLGNWE